MSLFLLVAVLITIAGTAFWYRFKPRAINPDWASKQTIVSQMNEPRPLPMGQKEFDEWSDRIISGALIPTDNIRSLKGVLSAFIMELGPTESHKPDAWFIHKLRKAAANEVAQANFQEAKKAIRVEAEAKEPPKDVHLTTVK